MNAPLQPASPGPIGALFSEHGDFVFRTLQYLGVPASSLDDGLQDVFVTAHRRWDTFEGRSSPRTWLYGIARRVAFRYRRKDENHRRRFVLTERIVEGVDAPFEQANARRSVQALLEALDEDKRASFVLVEVEGFTAAEAAELLEIPLGTVYSRVRAAWGRLRDAAHQDVQMSSLQVEMESERRVGLQRAVMAACLPAVALGTATATTGLGGLGWILGAAAAGALAVGIGVAVRASGPEPKPAEPASASASEVAERPSPPTPTRIRAIDASMSPASPAVTERRDSEESPSAEPTERAQRRVQAEGTKPEAEPPPSSLLKELALVRKAKELVRDGKPNQARAVLDEHALKFRDGQLVDERREILAGLAVAADGAAAPEERLKRSP